MTRRTLRLTAAAAVVALVLPLAACQTHQGTVAFIGDTRITTEQLDTQVDKFYADPYWAKRGEGQRAAVRSKTVQAMVLAELFRQLARAEGAELDKAELDKVKNDLKERPELIEQSFQGILAGASPEAFAGFFGHIGALQESITKSSASEADAQAKYTKILETAAKQHPVTLNPRYGKFDPNGFSIAAGTVPGIRDLGPLPGPGGEEAPGEPQPGQGEPQPGQGEPQPGQGEPAPPPPN